MSYFLIIAAVILRLIPHAPNFAPVTAIALFGGVYLKNKKLAIALPLLAMLFSDIFIGFYSLPIMVSVYASFALSGGLGLWLRKRKDVGNTMAVTLGASIQFYLITNFAVWAFGTMYPNTASGLLASYVNALPFFRNTLYGDFFYVGLMFGLYELVKYYFAKKLPLPAIVFSSFPPQAWGGWSKTGRGRTKFPLIRPSPTFSRRKDLPSSRSPEGRKGDKGRRNNEKTFGERPAP